MAESGEEEKEADLGMSPALLLGEQPGVSPATPHLPPAEPFLDRREEDSPQSSMGRCEDTNAPLKKLEMLRRWLKTRRDAPCLANHDSKLSPGESFPSWARRRGRRMGLLTSAPCSPAAFRVLRGQLSPAAGASAGGR